VINVNINFLQGAGGYGKLSTAFAQKSENYPQVKLSTQYLTTCG